MLVPLTLFRLPEASKPYELVVVPLPLGIAEPVSRSFVSYPNVRAPLGSPSRCRSWR